MSVGVITNDIIDAGVIPLQNTVDILNDITDSLYVITGKIFSNSFYKQNKNFCVNLFSSKKYDNIFLKILKNIYVQMFISFNILKLAKEVDIWIFFLDSHALLLPVLIAKLLSKRVVFLMAASIKNSAESQNDPFANVLIFAESITLKLCNKIILYSPSLIKTWNYEKYLNKIEINHQHILNFQEFKIKQNIGSRNNLVGFVGRLSHEKGILPLLKAIKKIYLQDCDIKFLIIGNGPLKNEVESFIQKNKMTNTSFLGWINHDDLPSYLNQMKLLVLPSYSEGLPNVIIEAMACGTPVLASKVGSIPDFIVDSKNGFILQNNSPECIEKNIIKILKYPKLENITLNALNFVEREFKRENVINKWKSTLNLIRMSENS